MNTGFVRNTVPGSRRGSKYPPEVRFACMAELLVKNNIHAVAQKYGVPESTLRTWWKSIRAAGAEEQSVTLAKVQQAAMMGIALDAAGGARLSLEMINQRLHRADFNAERCAEIDERLLEDDLPTDEEAKLKKEKELRPPMGDYPLANYARVLMSVREKALEGSVQQKEDTGFAVEIRVVE
ncbi:hypothetical protein LJB76_02840 [Clostridia bacterium OttesenSCG-928-O13]|nr:hypothetical protein [Clostridia bacterium OttesenSCG-928-O13]